MNCGTIRQINRSQTIGTGTVRGLHFQVSPNYENKIVTCIKGKNCDVVVDLRTGSSTFLQHYMITLTEDNFRSLFIPAGFAHGFQTLSEECELIYFHTADYLPDAEGGLNATDPMLGIRWPLEITNRSKRDLDHPFLSHNYQGVKLDELS